MLLHLRRAAVAVVAAIVAVLALGVGVASAHVSVSSPDAAPGGFGEVTFRVPTESDTASTTSLRVQLPTDSPLAFVSVKPVPGWTAEVTTTKLDTPIEAEGTTITEAASEVTWTAGEGAGIKPGEYQSFSISAGPLPDGDSMTLPAIQGYDDGTEVAWIEPTVEGQAEPEHPAPVLALTAPTAADGATDPATAPAADTSDQGTSSGLAVTALIVGILGLLAGIAGVAMALAARNRATAPGNTRAEREHSNV